jgi:GT2 family glycosyltransferase
MDSRNVSKIYGAYYFKNSCGRPYERNEPWLGFFAAIADRIISEIQPHTVLDAGCAMGFLVEALRDRGVEAAGVDISEYAIQHVRTDVRPFCWIGSLSDQLPQRYDLIVCIEVLEHCPVEELETIIENFCQHTDDILFSSTPFDYKEATHLNVRPPDYWAERFARRGFFRDADFDGTFLTPWAVRFRKSRDSFARVVAAYERRLWQLEKESHGRRELTFEQQTELEQKDGELQKLITLTESVKKENELQRLAHQTALAEKESEILALQQLNSKAGESELLIEALSREVEEGDREIRTLRSHASEMRSLAGLLSQEAIEKDRSIHALKMDLEKSQRDIDELSYRAAEKDKNIGALTKRLRDSEAQLTRITNTIGWRLLQIYGRIKYPYLLPLYRLFGLLPESAGSNAEKDRSSVITPTADTVLRDMCRLGEAAVAPSLQKHSSTVDIVICIHNALADVKNCLESVIRYSRPPYSLILVDDGSDDETHSYISEFASVHNAAFIRNDSAKGYTFAANQGLKQSLSDHVILLNSDTVVTPNWLDRMVTCGESDALIGIVGPMSNTASWQSIPDLFNQEDWAENGLPDGMSPSEMGLLLAQYSGRVYPRIPFLNGFCLMIKRTVLDQIGVFDEAAFGKGYGEENDYCLRARAAGWQLAVADDVYIYHHQSRSYSHERRKQLTEASNDSLIAKHGQQIISEGVNACRHDRIIEGARIRAKVMMDREEFVKRGLSRWEGKKVVFLLPITEPGGGGNVVLQEASAMQRMGVDVRILNLSEYRSGFERSYENSAIPVIYADEVHQIPRLTADADAVIATVYSSVQWMDFAGQEKRRPVKAYYVQDFEPDFFRTGSEAYRMAWNSYTVYPDLVRFTKTEWNREMVKEKVGAHCEVIGASVDIDLYRPRRRRDQDWPQRPLRIAGMIRPSTPRRNPKLTMEIFREVERSHGNTIEIILFGSNSDGEDFSQLPTDFPWKNSGILTSRPLALLLNEVDIFVDFSTFQAMGLTAMEAMACGAGVIVPERGGSGAFARHEANCLVADTSSNEACLLALERLIMDEKLRAELQRQALVDVCNHFPERAAYNLLSTLFETSSPS